MTDAVRPLEVLLVEDNPGDVLLVRQNLGREPYPINVGLAVDGEQGLQMLESNHFKPDLVILDLNIPKVFGAIVPWTVPGGSSCGGIHGIDKPS